jgi:hypothetical protein
LVQPECKFNRCFNCGCKYAVGFRDHYYQPWSLLEPATIALGLHLIYHKKFGWLAGLIAISTLNRETGIFLAAAYFFPWVLPNPFKMIRRKNGEIGWWGWHYCSSGH